MLETALFRFGSLYQLKGNGFQHRTECVRGCLAAMSFRLNEVVPWGRSFDEYVRMFALSDADLAGRTLGCADGPASFNAEATARGYPVISCDPIYALPASEIERRVNDVYRDMIAQVRAQQDGFVWDYFRDPDHLGECRLAAMNRFLEDYQVGTAAGRYVVASLPHLPFADGAFDLALVSHLLFLYSAQLDLAFHLAALTELLRVATEARIFPLLDLARQPSPHLEPLCELLVSRGFQVEIRSVPYEFQRGGNRMLRVRGIQSSSPARHKGTKDHKGKKAL